MKIKSPNRRSTAYRFTMVPGNKADAEKLVELKSLVDQLNSKYKGSNLNVYVRGRGPRRPNAIADGLHLTAYDTDLPLHHATHMDVYVR